MRHASLFSGIGGFDLAAQWMGWENVFQVEKDAFCQKVLSKNFPDTQRYGDIKEFDGTKYRGAVDIITGGFPCQPYSSAGKRKGKDDDRHLWPEMLRVIGEVQPTYIVGENVDGIINWSKGLVFEEVQKSLEDQGFEVQSYLLPACGVQGSHRRYRVWFVAHSTKEPFQEYEVYKKSWPISRESGVSSARTACDIWTPSRSTNFAELAGELHGVPNRVDRVGALGNAIVPQVAFQIFKAIEQTITL